MCREKLVENLQASRATSKEYIRDIPEGSVCEIVGCVESKLDYQWYYMMGNGTDCTNQQGILTYIHCMQLFHCDLIFTHRQQQ